jgi:serine/threonine protein kinase
MDLVCTTCNQDTGGLDYCSQHFNARVVVANGTVLVGKTDNYDIKNLLSAKGGTAVTYLAETSSGLNVVIKELITDSNATMQADNEIRFEREAILLKTLNSKYLPRGLDRFDDSGHKFFVQSFINGKDLSEFVKLNGAVPNDDALEIGIQCAEALGLLHDFIDPNSGSPDPILHRDIKPDNIILKLGTLEPVLIDFGSAVLTQSALVGQTTLIPGTPGYISQSRLNGNENPTDDLFSLAYVIIFLVTGIEPEDNNKNRDKLLKKLPSSWRQIFDFATQDIFLFGKGKAQINLRPKDWQEFRNQLIGLLSPAKQVSYGITPPTTAPAPATTVAPAPANVYIVTLQPSTTYIVDPHNYACQVQGRITLNGQPAKGLSLTPIISDIGGKSSANGPGTVLTTGMLGEFTLDYGDCEVPINISERDIELVFVDSAGVEVYKTTTTIYKPKNAAVAAAGSAFWAALGAPFKAYAEWRANQATIKSAVLAANQTQAPLVTTAQNTLQVAHANLKSARQTARQKAKQQIAQQQAQKKLDPNYVPPMVHVWNLLKPLLWLTLVIVAGYLLYQLGLYVYAWSQTVNWQVWGPWVARIIGIGLTLSLLVYLIPIVYSFAKQHNWGSRLKAGGTSVGQQIKKAPATARALITGALVFVIFTGFALHQNWLIMFPLVIIPMLAKYRSSAGLKIRSALSFLLACIALAVCLQDVQRVLSWLGVN